MSAFGDMIVSEYRAKCPHCAASFASNEVRPSCNECESCFCTYGCREAFHASMPHNYTKPLEQDQ